MVTRTCMTLSGHKSPSIWIGGSTSRLAFSVQSGNHWRRSSSGSVWSRWCSGRHFLPNRGGSCRFVILEQDNINNECGRTNIASDVGDRPTDTGKLGGATRVCAQCQASARLLRISSYMPSHTWTLWRIMTVEYMYNYELAMRLETRVGRHERALLAPYQIQMLSSVIPYRPAK